VSQSLEGLKVIDCATLFAGPVVATILGDFGADVIKVEHPRGDSLRGLGWHRDDVSLWWTVVSRNKRCVSLVLSNPQGADLFKRLVADADVLVENFRPGTLERWGLGPDVLQEINPGLVMVRTTAFGQDGPYSHLPGFGTLAEAMSGFAHINGWADGPPTLPPFALGDGIAALTGAYATMIALWDRQRSGNGQVVDLSIVEPLFSMLGPQATVYDQLGIVQGRTGNAAPFTAPRNAYKSKDDKWLALSGSAQSIAERVAAIVGREDWVDEEWFQSHSGRLEHVDELDASIGGWIGDHTADEVMAAFAKQEGAIAPIYSIADIFKDPQFEFRQSIIQVKHPELGEIAMANVVPKLSRTPGAIRFPGPTEIGANNEEVFGALGLDVDQIDKLRADKVI
jgi:crotonobetainyl-CoA:carnitine CoA-transferase CaiB-like acyl-CoA transferase